MTTIALAAALTAVSATLDDWHAAAAKADEARYFAHMTAGAVFLGTDGSERWDKAAFQAYAHPHFVKGKGWSLTPSDRHVSFSADGNTAWFDEKVLSPSYGPSRGSGVLVKDGADWKIAQYNLSVPVPNGLLMKVAGMIKDGWPAADDLTVEESARLLAARHGDKGFAVLDVRTPAENASGRIAGAVNIDFDAPDFKEKIAALDKDRTYLVHCAKGGRSAKALKAMKDAGIRDAHNMLGGMKAWAERGFPVEK